MVIHAVLAGCPAAGCKSSVTPDLVVRLKLPALQLCKRGSLTHIQQSGKCMQQRPIFWASKRACRFGNLKVFGQCTYAAGNIVQQALARAS